MLRGSFSTGRKVVPRRGEMSTTECCWPREEILTALDLRSVP